MLAGFYDGMLGVEAGYTIRDVAIEGGHANIDDSHFECARLPPNTSEEVLPGLRMIRDSFNDKMFRNLFRGTTKKAVYACARQPLRIECSFR